MSPQESQKPSEAQTTAIKLLPIRRDNGFSLETHWIWCPSIIQGPDGKWHMFASAWPKTLPFHPAWLTNSEIVRAVSDNIEGPYRFEEVVLPARGPEYWDGCATHNPVIREHGGKYYLFYTGISYPFARPAADEKVELSDPRVVVARTSKRIGVAVADKITGPWRRLDAPILPVKPGSYYSYLTSNAAPYIHDDGSVTLVFKSRRYEGSASSRMYLGVARASNILGPYDVAEKYLLEEELEDPFLWQEGGTWHMIAKDMRGRLTPEEGALAFIQFTEPGQFSHPRAVTACKKELRWTDGETKSLAHMERPSLVFQNGKATHICAAIAEGDYGFRNLVKTWNAVIPIERQP